jgi:zinc metalloprotease ZmpA
VAIACIDEGRSKERAMIVSSLSRRRLTTVTLMASIVVVAATGCYAVPADAAVAGLDRFVVSTGEEPSPSGAAAAEAAVVVQAWVATRPAQLRIGPEDVFVQHPTITSAGWSYVPYDRTYRGLPVVGGDFVVVIDPAGRIRMASAAQQQPIMGVTIPAAVTAQAAQGVESAHGTQLVVYARSGAPRLAWERTDAAAETTSYVDVVAGTVLERRSGIAYGFGYSLINGPNPLPISTRHVHFSIYDRYYLIDPFNNGMSCGNTTVHQPYMQTTDAWGNRDEHNLVTACVNAMFAQQTMIRMLAQWLGRSGIDGAGHGFPMWVGIDKINAFWSGLNHDATFGHYEDGRWLTSLDLVGHELGHAVDEFTPGGPSGHGTIEFIGDVFGTATERFAMNRPVTIHPTSSKQTGTAGPAISSVSCGPQLHRLIRSATTRVLTPLIPIVRPQLATAGST